MALDEPCYSPGKEDNHHDQGAAENDVAKVSDPGNDPCQFADDFSLKGQEERPDERTQYAAQATNNDCQQKKEGIEETQAVG